MTSQNIKDLRRRWVEALRSGDYIQGRGQLRHTDQAGDSFCCLGVVCDLLNGDGWSRQNEEDVADEGCYFFGQSSARVTPYFLCEKLGMTRSQIKFLTILNDLKRYSFDQIADWIERETVASNACDFFQS